MSGAEVTSIVRVNSHFEATTRGGEVFFGRTVVLANGAYQQPAIPHFARALAPEVAQFTALTYRRPEQVPRGAILVVGDGATGRQIALDLARHRQSFLAVGRRRRVSPDRIGGRSIFWWMERAGILEASRESLRGRLFMKSDPFPGKQLTLKRLARQGVTIMPRVREVHGPEVIFMDGTRMGVDALIWTTGFREDTRWIRVRESKDARQNLIHRRGVTPVRGLYLLGRPWLWTRGSSLLLGVGRDAEFLARHIEGELRGGIRPY
jgi:putative flavoprotein involved in K+ transport